MLVAGLIFVSCGEKKEELTGLHKEFDIIFNEVKEEGVSEFNANKEEIAKEAKNSTRNEKEEKAMLNTYEIMFEAFEGSTYSVEEFLMESMEEILKKVKKGKVPMIEQEMTVQMFKENDKWGIDDNTKNILMGRMLGSQKGTIFSF